MWSDKTARAARLRAPRAVEPFDWGPAHRRHTPVRADLLSPDTLVPAPGTGPNLQDVERDAYARGYADGERAAGSLVAMERQAAHVRIADTLARLDALRAELLQKTERQVVQLALAIAGRVLRRELSVDRELLVAIARIAIDRLGEQAPATVRLNPDDYTAISAARIASESAAVRIVADPMVAAGGCLVQTEFGVMEVGLDAQLAEMAHALVGDAGAIDENSAEREFRG